MIKKSILGAFMALSIFTPADAQSPPFNSYSIATLGGNCATAAAIPYQKADASTACTPGGVNGQAMTLVGGVPQWTSLAGAGSVTSVALSLPSIFNVTGSPITASGTLTGTLASQAQNLFFASPDGSAGAPSFRSMVSADIPSLDTSKLTSGTLPVARGGTGVTTSTGTGNVVLSASPTLSGTTTAATVTATNVNVSTLLDAEYINTDSTAQNKTAVWFVKDTQTGTVNVANRQATIGIHKDVDSTPDTGNGYNSIGPAEYVYLGYGQNNAGTYGTTGLSGGHMNIYNMAPAPAGRTEITPIANGGSVPIYGGSFASGANFYYDLNIQSTPSAGQEGYLGGISMAVQKRAPGNVVDANHNGSVGINVMTTPNTIGFDSQDHTNHTTYPLNALMSLTGWSGTPATASSGGQDVDATPAAAIGIKIGGNMGSVWSNHTQYSYIPTGIDIQDYTVAGINIANPNTAHSPANVAINTAPGAGNVIVGDSVYVGNAGGGGILQGRTFVSDNTAGSQSKIGFNVGGVAKWELGRQTDDAFYLYDYANNQTPIQITTNGDMVIGEPSKFLRVPSMATGTNAYFVCADASKGLLIQASACTISSQRFKENIEPLANALDTVAALSPVTFNMKGTSADDINYSRTQIGLIAERVAEVAPNAAIFEQDGKTVKSYRPESIIALQVGAIKSLNEKIKALEVANDNMNNRLIEIEKRLSIK